MLTISDRGLDIIREFEGFSAEPYLCPGGYWTIGYGHTRGVSADTEPVTKDEAMVLLWEDAEVFENSVRSLVKVPLTQNQFDALVSFAYNVGANNLARSTLLKKVNMSDYHGAALEFAKWRMAGGKVLAGLKQRRKAEALLFLTPDDTHGDMVLSEYTTKEKTMFQSARESLQGWKTYIVGVAAILGTAAAWIAGDLSIAEAVQAVITAIMGMTIRAGIANEAAK